jgi:hypothetical protein
MVARIVGTLLLTGGLFFSGVIAANAFPYPPPNPPRRSAPELDPSSLGAGVVMLAGGLLALNERRRLKQK